MAGGEGTVSGGVFQGIEPTYKRADIRGADVMDVSDGLVRHNTIYHDGVSFARPRRAASVPRTHTS